MSATAVLNLSKAGFTDAQVTALVEFFEQQTAAKAHLDRVQADIERMRSDREQLLRRHRRTDR